MSFGRCHSLQVKCEHEIHDLDSFRQRSGQSMGTGFFCALHSDRLDPLDVFGGKRELFSLKVFFHMLRARRAG